MELYFGPIVNHQFGQCQIIFVNSTNVSNSKIVSTNHCTFSTHYSFDKGCGIEAPHLFGRFEHAFALSHLICSHSNCLKTFDKSGGHFFWLFESRNILPNILCVLLYAMKWRSHLLCLRCSLWVNVSISVSKYLHRMI